MGDFWRGACSFFPGLHWALVSETRSCSGRETLGEEPSRKDPRGGDVFSAERSRGRSPLGPMFFSRSLACPGVCRGVLQRSLFNSCLFLSHQRSVGFTCILLTWSWGGTGVAFFGFLGEASAAPSRFSLASSLPTLVEVNQDWGVEEVVAACFSDVKVLTFENYVENQLTTFSMMKYRRSSGAWRG